MSDEFYAGIAGAFIGLLGVLATLWWTQKHHERSLAQERQKAKDEREFAARQSAIASAGEAITRFTQYLLTLPDRDLPPGGIIAEEVRDFGVALSRLHFYCSIETIEKSIELGQTLTEAFSRAVKAKLPSLFLNEDIKGIDLHIAALEKMNSEMHQEIIALIQGAPGSPLILSNRDQIVSNHQTMASLHAKKSELSKRKFMSTEACRDIVQAAIPSIYAALSVALIRMRRELAFELDESRYSSLMDKSTKQATAALQALMADVRKQIHDKLKEA